MNNSKKHGILKKNEPVFFFAKNEELENVPKLVVSETLLFYFRFLRFIETEKSILTVLNNN